MTYPKTRRRRRVIKRFKNGQWAVTAYGLGTVKPEAPYGIDKKRLMEKTVRGGETYYDWPVHLAEKNWVDLNAFNEAYREALEHHVPRSVDYEMLEASIDESRRMRSRSWR